MEKNKYEVLHTATEYIERLNNGIMQTASYYRNGELAKGYKYVEMITEGIEWVIDVITLTQDVLIREIEVDCIRELVSEYIDAMENEDNVLMADLLEYEMLEQMQSWKEILVESIKTIEEKDSNEA